MSVIRQITRGIAVALETISRSEEDEKKVSSSSMIANLVKLTTAQAQQIDRLVKDATIIRRVLLTHQTILDNMTHDIDSMKQRATDDPFSS